MGILVRIVGFIFVISVSCFGTSVPELVSEHKTKVGCILPDGYPIHKKFKAVQYWDNGRTTYQEDEITFDYDYAGDIYIGTRTMREKLISGIVNVCIVEFHCNGCFGSFGEGCSAEMTFDMNSLVHYTDFDQPVEEMEECHPEPEGAF